MHAGGRWLPLCFTVSSLTGRIFGRCFHDSYDIEDDRRPWVAFHCTAYLLEQVSDSRLPHHAARSIVSFKTKYLVQLFVW